MGRNRKDLLASAREAWGDSIPDWVEALARAVMRANIGNAARTIGYSSSTVSYVLSKKYSGDIAKVEQAVRGALFNETVECPILGEIGRHRCLQEQRKNFIGSSAIRTKLFHKCRGIGTAICPHSLIEREAS